MEYLDVCRTLLGSLCLEAAVASRPPCTVSHKFICEQVDAQSQCPNVDHHEGKMQACLKDHRALLSWDCQEELFRQEVENADDLRLSVRLFKACLGDKKKVKTIVFLAPSKDHKGQKYYHACFSRRIGQNLAEKAKCKDTNSPWSLRCEAQQKSIQC